MSENTFKIPVIPLRGLTILPGTTVILTLVENHQLLPQMLL